VSRECYKSVTIVLEECYEHISSYSKECNGGGGRGGG
jgi:hypothetical protein